MIMADDPSRQTFVLFRGDFEQPGEVVGCNVPHVLPAMPAFYTRPQTLADAVDFVVGRVCDQLGVEHDLVRRWGAAGGPAEPAGD